MVVRLTASLLAVLIAAILAGPDRRLAAGAPTDLDRFMERVLARRDENWKKLQQYVLDERERLEVVGPGSQRLYGYQREYTWFIKEGVFVRSPLRADGVAIGEAARHAYEDDWIAREQRRDAQGGAADGRPAAHETPASVGDVLRQSVEPRFVSAAYFLKFKFEPGRYALVGRELVDGREAFRIEYYPARLFTEGRARPARSLRDRDHEIEEKMNKVSIVTLWIEPGAHQILRYTFNNIDPDFLPGRWIMRVDELQASMRMIEPFSGVWLPGDIELNFHVTLAVGAVTARYAVEYHDYRVAEVTTRVR